MNEDHSLTVTPNLRAKQRVTARLKGTRTSAQFIELQQAFLEGLQAYARLDKADSAMLTVSLEPPCSMGDSKRWAKMAVLALNAALGQLNGQAKERVQKCRVLELCCGSMELQSHVEDLLRRLGHWLWLNDFFLGYA